jgi:uncharacterized protein (DUF924 family)
MADMQATMQPMTQPMTQPTAQQVLDFWFLPAGAPGHDARRLVWFRKDPAFDDTIRERFGAAVAAALAGDLTDWDDEGPGGALARILLLDQFTRNIYRGQARAFSGDALALAAARGLVDSGADLLLSPWRRAFVYMPFEHAEDEATQQQSVDLFARLQAAAPETEHMLDFAQRHQEVIARFGRYPHRNALLQRPSTPEEMAWLALPGSGF